jgi:predicted nuclease of restriction endonuclease-like (RecB) superfamily
VLVEQVKAPAARLWYARKAVENGWSRSVLVHWVESDLYGRQGKAQTNFERTLPAPQSDLARETLKDPYKFEFLTPAGESEEREFEEGLLAHVRTFLSELGAGFTFVGRQVRFDVGGEDFHVDLLFYHLKLRCFLVVVDPLEEAPGGEGTRTPRPR